VEELIGAGLLRASEASGAAAASEDESDIKKRVRIVVTIDYFLER
jgi:hypothetical protein